jgi:uncharacterized protein (UPF0332 family)
MKLDDCYKKGQLKKMAKNPELVENALQMARDDLAASEQTFSNDHYVWATIQAYTSILNMARAILFSDGIRERSHFCAVEYLRTHYREHFGDLIEKMDILRRERHLSLYDSRDHITPGNVNERIQWAKMFLEKTDELLSPRDNID